MYVKQSQQTFQGIKFKSINWILLWGLAFVVGIVVVRDTLEEWGVVIVEAAVVLVGRVGVALLVVVVVLWDVG